MTDLRSIHLEAPDFLQQDAIRAAVRGTYAAVRPTDRRVAERFYDRNELAGLPDDTVRIALGVGDPVRYAGLQPGERVLDLGLFDGTHFEVLAGVAPGDRVRLVGSAVHDIRP